MDQIEPERDRCDKKDRFDRFDTPAESERYHELGQKGGAWEQHASYTSQESRFALPPTSHFNLFSIVKLFVTALFCSAVAVLIYHVAFVAPKLEKLAEQVPRLVVFNLDGYVARVKRELLRGEIGLEDAKRDFSMIEKAMQSLPSNVVVVEKSCVLKGTLPELTLQELLQAEQKSQRRRKEKEP